MVSVCFYFQVHQPRRLRNYSIFDIKNNQNYFDDIKNEEVMKKVAGKCYLPMNNLLLKLINKYKVNNPKGDFKVSFAITGTAIEQFEKYSPEVLESFKELAKTGCVEFVAETYYHSLSFLYNKDEFRHQVDMHKQKMKELFNYEPKVFRNTELIYNNDLAMEIEKLGFKAIITEGPDHILDWKSPNFIYKPTTANIKMLLKNYKLSDDIAFRFSNKGWEEYPLTVKKFEQWLSSVNGNGDVVNLFMDYETFGEHQWEDTGIFQFMESLPEQVMKHPDNNFVTVSEAADLYPVRGELDIHNFISWADLERDLSAWLGNDMQNVAITQLYQMLPKIKDDPQLLKMWRYLTTSDHFYYMCTKWFSDGDVHKYFNPYESPYEGYIAFMNILNDFRYRVQPSEGVPIVEKPSMILTR